MFDLVVRHGTVVDGTGAAPQRADIGISRGRMEAVGDLSAVEGPTLDATGLIVAPGFIDIHSHSDFTLLVDPRAQSAVAQGVTTELIGNCGHGGAPIVDPEAAKANIYGYHPSRDITWHSMAEYLDELQAARPAVNILTLVPHGMLRLAAIGFDERPARPDELQRMIAELEAGLDEGAWGYSTGLEYPTERASGQEELLTLCRITAKRGGLYAPHVRNRADRALEAIDEAIQQAEASGARMHIPHLMTRRAGPLDTNIGALERVDAALARGIDVSMDGHTRPFGLTNLNVALPAAALAGGAEALRQRLSDPAQRREYASRGNMILSYSLGGWERVKVLTSKTHPEWAGVSFAAIAEQTHTTPFDAVLDLMRDEADDPTFPLVLCESHTEAQMLYIFRHPRCMVGSDATTLAVDGPLAGQVFHGAFTWASWFIRRWVREEGVFTIQEAVRKMSGLPAQRIGLKDRGLIRAGAWADLAIFDLAQFRDTGTVLQPNQLASGMKHVLVNGRAVYRDGAFTGQRAGRVLRR